MLILGIIIVAFAIAFSMVVSTEMSTYHQGEELYLPTPEEDACLHCHIAGSAPAPQVPNYRWITFGSAGLLFLFGITRNLSVWKTRDENWQYRWMPPLSKIITGLFFIQILAGVVLVFFAKPMPEGLLDTAVSFDYVLRAIHWGSGILLFITTLIFSFLGSQAFKEQRIFWGSLFALELLGGLYAMNQLSLAYLRADWVITLTPAYIYALHLLLLPSIIASLMSLYFTRTEKSND